MSRVTDSAESSNVTHAAESPDYMEIPEGEVGEWSSPVIEEGNSTAGSDQLFHFSPSYSPAQSSLFIHLHHPTGPHSSQNYCSSCITGKNNRIIQWAQQASRDQSKYRIPPTLLASTAQFEQQAAVEESAPLPLELLPLPALQQHAAAVCQVYQAHEQPIRSYITAHVPELDQQLQALMANGWHLENALHEPRGAYTDPLHKQIVVDLNITTSAMGGRSSISASKASQFFESAETDTTVDLTDRNAYIAALANQIGQAQDDRPISIQSRDGYINDNLCHQANGIWNELMIRDRILSRHGEDIWAHCTPQWRQFVDIYEAYSTSSTDEPDGKRAQEKKAKQDIAKGLAQLHTPDGKHTYADAYGEQYDSFQLPDNLAESNGISLNALQDYFNQTGRVLSATQIKQCTYSKNGDFAWLTHQRSKQINFEREPEFRSFQSRMMPGSNVSDIVMQLFSESRRYETSLDRNIHHYQTDWQNGAIPLWIQYGGKPGEIINVSRPLAPLPTVNEWQLPEIGPSHASPLKPPSIDESVLTGELSQFFKSYADQSGITPEAYLQGVVQRQYQCHESIEYPGYQVYRKLIKDEASGQPRFCSVVAKTQNNCIVDVKVPTIIDSTFMLFPKREAIYNELKKAGWSIKFNSSGEGSSNQSIKEIQLPIGAPFTTLVHEMAHAKYQQNHNIASMEAYIENSMLNEGNSLFHEYQLIDEIGECALLSPAEKNGFKQTLEKGYGQKRGNSDAEYAIYQRWREDREDQKAIRALGEIYSTYCPSTCPMNTTYRELWETDYQIIRGDKTPEKLLSKLQSQTGKLPQVWDESVGWESAATHHVALIYPLPPQPEKGDEKVLFISRATLYREAKNYDPRLFRLLANNGLKYGDINVTDGLGSNVKIATATFNQSGVDYRVHYHYDHSGQVFALKIETSSIDAPKVEPPDVVVPSAAA